MKVRGNFFLLLVFLLLSIAIFYVGDKYKEYKINEYTFKKYNTISTSLSNEVSTLIKEKKNATLAIAISFAKSEDLKKALFEKNVSSSVLQRFSRELREETDFKNVWIQLIDKNGVSLSRNWTSKNGDNLAKIREDVRSMNNQPKIKSSISVGRFDMTFKAMVPVYNSKTDYIGFIEVITHFNSIAKKIKEKDFEPLVVVNKKYKKQITKPFTKIFAGDHYIANKNANKQIVEYVEQKGLDYFLSPNQNYIIDNEKNNIVVNYTLFDTNKEPMADFLMFKSLKSLDLSSVESMSSTINLFVLLSVVLTAVFFYIVSNKESMKIDTDAKTNIYIFVFLFLLTSFIFYIVLDWNFEQKREKFIESYNQNIKKDYQIIQKKFSTVADTMYHSILDKPYILSLMEKAYENKQQKSIARKELYKALVKDYEFFKSYELRQLHFHLKNNESFLRFHRPDKFGDNLTGVRATVEWVNKNKSKIAGFEEGRIYNGFRYVFPLLKKKYTGNIKHLGSVETSFSANAIASEFAVSHNTKAGFIIKEDVVDGKVFNDEKSNYIKSPFTGYLYEKSIKKQLEHSFIQVNIKLLDDRSIDDAARRVEYGEVFSIPSKDDNTLFTFIPFKNPVSQKVVSAIILQKDTVELNAQENLHIVFLLSGITAILFVLLYIYKEFSSKHRFRLMSLKTQKILDAQKSIVIITDGRNIIDANKNFLEYFGFGTLAAFKKKYDCICEHFEEDDRFFHLGKVPEGELWIDTLKKLSYKEHIVAMKNSKNQQNIFVVSMNKFDNNEILSFNNISDTMKEHFSLMERVSHDKLTGAYNRDYFDNNKDIFIQEALYKNLKLGIIIFDIDFFKSVNDTYGHNRGDEVLKHLVSLIHNMIRQEDILVRWGGEEFLLVVNISSLVNLFHMAENIRKKIKDEVFEEVGSISCSFGVTIYNDEPIENTIQRADEALYKAKKLGRNRVISKDINK